MKELRNYMQKQKSQTGIKQDSLKVRTDVRAGAWNCADCQGEVTGNQLFKPTCEYCKPA